MRRLHTDLSVYNRFGFVRPPVGVKYLFFKPKGIEPLAAEKSLSFCEMLKEAQEAATPFYFSKENNEICVGKILLGMQEMEPFAETGQIGARLEIFQEPRANQAFYQHIPMFPKGTVNYVAFSALQYLTFEPDVLIVTAPPSQAEIVMRAMAYSTGEVYVSKTTPVMGCAWTYIYPFRTGKVNYVLPRMIHGMTGRQLFPEDAVLIAIPYQWLQTVTQNLQEMKWDLHAGKERYLSEFGRVLGELVEESREP